MRKLIFFGILLIMTACQSGDTNVRSPYFSIPEFFRAECSSLKKQKAVLIKKVQYDGKEELMQINQPDWENELRPFLDCDLNKPAYAGAYTIDTAMTDGAYAVFYKAKEPKMPIRMVSLNYANDKLVSVYMETGKSNSWFRLRQEMTFTPGEGYQIKGSQKMAIGKETKFTISGSVLSTSINSQP